jgi:hypothetical protein
MSLRHGLLALALSPLLLACTTAHAGRLVDVQIVDRENGASLPLYPYRSETYVAGAPGHRYAVRIVNSSGRRVLAVLSVDGVNAISGETAATDQTGYVLEPYQSTEVAGWRKNMNEIAAFEFTTLSDSYAAQTGRPANVGVIGVAVFREKYVPPPPPVYHDRIAAEAEGGAREDKRARNEAIPMPKPGAAPAPPATAGAAADSAAARSATTAQPQESLGTGHGQRETSSASYTSFERESRKPYEVVAIRYDSYANLQARGIVPRRPPPRPQQPNPFPDSFVPDPPRR